MSEKRLRALIAEWRDTANTWERQSKDPATFYGARPPLYQRSSYKNWINWLRKMADDVESAIEPVSETRG